MRLKGNVNKILWDNGKIFIFSLSDRTRIKFEGSVEIGKTYEFEGDFFSDSRGKIFKAESIKEIQEQKNLLPHLIEGIGPQKAKQIEDELGENYMDLLKENPKIIYRFFSNKRADGFYEQLKNIDFSSRGPLSMERFLKNNMTGIALQTIRKWLEFLGDEKLVENPESAYVYFCSESAHAIVNEISKLDAYLQTLDELDFIGFSPVISLRLMEKYKLSVMNELSKNPYIAMDMGLSFFETDEIAVDFFDFERESIHRISKGIEEVLLQNEENGNTFMNKKDLIAETKNLLFIDSESLIEDVLNLSSQMEEPFFIMKNDKIYRRVIFFTERKIALQIADLVKEKPKTIPYKAKDVICASRLDDYQKKAVTGLISNKISILTGGPGTGKSTCVRTLCNALEAMNATYTLASPTGRAAKRLSEVTGKKAETLHRVLGYKKNGIYGSFMVNENYPLKVDYLILDEVSMMDMFLTNSAIKALGKNTHLILIGDVDQLPSVSSGNILQDLKESGFVTTFTLEKVYRQGEESDIIGLSKAVNASETYTFVGSDVEWVTPDVWLKYMNLESQILTPVKDYHYGTRSLNDVIQSKLNPSGKEVYLFGTHFKEGDKIIQMKNDYDKEVFNGEMGEIKSIDFDAVKIHFPNNTPEYVIYSFKDMKNVELAYAITIHKSQGSEFDDVTLILEGGFLFKEIIYTAITRAKRKLTIVSSMNPNEIVKIERAEKRATDLAAQIKYHVQKNS